MAVAVVAALRWAQYAQELVFGISLLVLAGLWWRLARTLEPYAQDAATAALAVIFVFRAAPDLRDVLVYFQIDRFGFDQVFLQKLGTTYSLVSILGLWCLAYIFVKLPPARTLFLMIVLNALLALPGLALVLGIHEYTEMLGVGVRDITWYSNLLEARFSQIPMIPLLTLIALYAPAAHRATWFALMASIMNLALAAGQLQTKYLMHALSVERGSYDNLAVLYALAVALGLFLPVAVLLPLQRRLT